MLHRDQSVSLSLDRTIFSSSVGDVGKVDANRPSVLYAVTCPYKDCPWPPSISNSRRASVVLDRHHKFTIFIEARTCDILSVVRSRKSSFARSWVEAS